MSWLNQNSLIYQILIDRFAGFDPDCDDTQPQWCGGNLAGITQKLDYLDQLGVDAIWLTPFFKSSAYHGYDIESFYKIDPHFGDKQDLENLIQEAHSRDIKVVVDFIANHCSTNHPFFIDSQRKRDSQYRDWFYYRRWPDRYDTFLDFANVPKLNLDYPPARKHIINSACYWVREFDIDGFRFDHVIGPRKDFWEELTAELTKTKQDLVLLGEVAFFGIPIRSLHTILMEHAAWYYLKNRFLHMDTNVQAMQQYVDIFDGCFDFSFLNLMRKFAFGKLSLDEVEHQLQDHYNQLPDDFLLPTFLDNHDKSRFLHLADDNIEKLKTASAFQYRLPQPAVIYYGTEVGMSHDYPVIENSHNHSALLARKTMNWKPDPQQQELLEFYQELKK